MNTTQVDFKLLIEPWIKINKSCSIKGLTINSQDVKKDFLFIAINGEKHTSNDFIEDAIKNGATCILKETNSDLEDRRIEYGDNCLVVKIKNLKNILSDIGGRFYNYPSKNHRIIGVTGTNGKTSITHIIAQWVDVLGQKSTIMGTNGSGELNNLKPSINTTGNPISIQKNIHDFAMIGSKITAMEVSSHGLVQNRVKNINFDVAIFTNLSRDHLDYHKTMESYEESKFLFFSTHNVKNIVLNYDDLVGQKWSKKLNNCFLISTKNDDLSSLTKNYIFVKNIRYVGQKTLLICASHLTEFEIEINLLGSFNITNVLLSLASLLLLGFKLDDLINTAEKLVSVEGRMEIFHNYDNPTVVVDYAHTPDALNKALSSLSLKKGKIWCVFGCGGDRDRGKRGEMGRIADNLSDKLILTNDNPRTEDPKLILDDIMSGIKDKTNLHIIPDRSKAIQYAIEKADQNDIIMVAGKGHENYQIIGDKKIVFSDRDEVKKALGLKNDTNSIK